MERLDKSIDICGVRVLYPKGFYLTQRRKDVLKDWVTFWKQSTKNHVHTIFLNPDKDNPDVLHGIQTIFWKPKKQ